jgi:hypothetical protein
MVRADGALSDASSLGAAAAFATLVGATWPARTPAEGHRLGAAVWRFAGLRRAGDNEHKRRCGGDLEPGPARFVAKTWSGHGGISVLGVTQRGQ